MSELISREEAKLAWANGEECMIANHKEKQEWQGRGKRKKPKVK